MTTKPEIHNVDVIIVGSGAAGLTAALAAQDEGLRCLVIEKGSHVGGTTAYSGGALWIPNNPVAKASGFKDSKAHALEYMKAAIGDAGPASSIQRRRAYLDHGPQLVDFLKNCGFKWYSSKVGYPDYYPNLPGALPKGGRTLEPARVSTKQLGDWQKRLMRPACPLPAIHNHQTPGLTRPMASMGDFLSASWVITKAKLRAAFTHDPVTMGQSLVTQLLRLALDRDIPIWLESELVDLVTDASGRVTGALIQRRDGHTLEIRAQQGVLLAAGGFSRNATMRGTHQPAPVADGSWTLTQPHGDTGTAIELAQRRAGAATALLDDAWWIPVLADPVGGGRATFAVFEMCKPFCVLVDARGERFMAEADPYADAGRAMLARGAAPAWLVLDARHRRRYMLGSLPPRTEPSAQALRDGRVLRAGDLDTLARQMRVDARGLRRTVDRWNGMCARGVDGDFGKGGDAYHRFLGDPNVRPNPNMGPVAQAPFYAVRVWPGDIGTKGGLLTDEHARVLREDGRPVEGLYAAGNTSASVMGRKYCGAGATIGPAMVFGYVAARHMGAQIESPVSPSSIEKGGFGVEISPLPIL
ncbi:FAD binding domain-containing protein [Xylariomycetidae sp. FL0641]|nr:FAD binding domain-containing protein [Xylariomycetidae sp. FL0641]